MKCLKNCIFMRCSQINSELPCRCIISKKQVNFGETCPYENKTVTELNMDANYEKELKKNDFNNLENDSTNTRNEK